MEFILELVVDFLLELLLEGGMEGSVAVASDKKRSKWTRCLALFLVVIFSLLFVGLILVLIWSGIGFLTDSMLAGIFFIGLGALFAISGIKQAREVYRRVKERKELS